MFKIIRKIREDRANRNRFYEYVILITTIIIVLLFSIFSFLKYTGYGTAINAEAGYISELEILDIHDTVVWHGFYGLSLQVPGFYDLQSALAPVNDVTRKDAFFNCLNPSSGSNEMYLSLFSNASFTDVVAGTPSIIDDYLGYNGSEADSANKTFTESFTFYIGGTAITNVPGMYTYKSSAPSIVFKTGILNSSDNFLMVVETASIQSGFNPETVNYQALVPSLNATTRYYFLSDPNDICLGLGNGTGTTALVNSTLYGYVKTTTGTAINNATVYIAGSNNQSISTGYYSIRLNTSEGWHVVVTTKSGYITNTSFVYVTNNDTYHNITLVAESPAGSGPGAGAGLGAGTGAGGGGGGGGSGPYTIPPTIEKPYGIEVYIPTDEINKKIPQNTFIEELLTVYNFKDTPVSISFVVKDDVFPLIELSRNTISVPASSYDSIIVKIMGIKDLGKYTGSIEVLGDIIKTIPVNIEIVENRLPIEVLILSVDVLKKTVTQGSKLNYKVNLKNLLSEQSYKVKLNYLFTDENNTILLEDSEEVELKTAISLLKSFDIPKNMTPSDYFLRVDASYLNLTTVIKTPVKVILPFHLYKVFGIIPIWYIMVAISIISLIVLAIELYKRHLEKKKRYHIELHLDNMPKPGPRSAYVGKIAETNVKAYFDLEQLKMHTIVAGATGRGKTTAAQDIVEEALQKNVAVIVVDPTAQWSGMLRKCVDKRMLSFYPKFNMKPSDARGFNGNLKQIKNPREKIDIVKYIKPGEVQVFSINTLSPKDSDIFVANTIREVFHSNPQESVELKLLMVYDEVHRLLPKFGGTGEGFIQIERACREFRKWGIGMILISQVLSDFVGEIKANINTEIQARTIEEGDLERIKGKYGEDVLKSLVKADVGVAMIQNAEYNKGKPYFINFRPICHSVTRLSDSELENFNKYNDIIDDIEYQIEQLEQEKIDVFDLKLELKLALDKLKTGNFNMVDIYLEGLKPRLKSQWDKLGKQPKKRELKLIEESELNAAVEKAKEARKKYEKEHKEESKEKSEDESEIKIELEKAKDEKKKLEESDKKEKEEKKKEKKDGEEKEEGKKKEGKAKEEKKKLEESDKKEKEEKKKEKKDE